MQKTGVELVAEDRAISRARVKFSVSSRYFRIRCNETFEERDLETLNECYEWADKSRRLMPDEPLGFVITRVVEAETDY